METNRLLVWAAALCLASAPLDAARAQTAGGTELGPDEVRVTFFFAIATSYETPVPRERETSGGKGMLKVVGNYAALMTAPAPGRRTLTRFRRLGGAGTGIFSDQYDFERTHEYGEGGWHPWQTKRRETWDAGEIPVSVPGFFLDIDLDASTWTMADLEDEPNRWFNELGKVLSFWGNYLEQDDNGTPVWRVSASPEKSSVAGYPWITRTGLDLVTSPSSYSVRTLRTPKPLQREGTSLRGSSEGSSPRVAGFQTSWGMFWGIYQALPDLELQVSAPGFEDWRPKAGNNPDTTEKTPGPPLVLTAQVVQPAGGPPLAVRIKKLRWSLVDTSRLPGVAMNFPYQSQDTSFDLEIDHDRATDEKQNLVLEDLTTLKSSIRVVPYDWGGWSTLRVEAELDDGRKLQGIYHGPHGDQTDILLPARDPNTKIARNWKKTMKASEADDADEDQIPPGNPSVLGDGFSLFEEYRGFYVSGSVDPSPSAKPHRGWVSLHPLRHHVFIWDRLNTDDTREAIRLFANATGLKVYVILPGDPFLGPGSVMNPNRGAGPTRGNQSAIEIEATPSPAWNPFGGNGRPGRSRIFVPTPSRFSAYTPKLKNRPDLYRRAIAQELLRSCGVQLPGRGDQQMTLTVSRDSAGTPVVRADNGGIVFLRDEAGRDLAEAWLQQVDRSVEVVRLRLRGIPVPSSVFEATRQDAATRSYYVARQGGEHSGPLGNIMRYTMADAYRIEGTGVIVVLPGGFKETVGWTLSTTSAGDGYNAESAIPRRYGDSPAPPPAQSVVVNDHAP